MSTNLQNQTISLNAQYCSPIEKEHNFVEYNLHSLYGYKQSEATYNYLLKDKNAKRPFILSRSTFPGSGKFTAHWTGDNWASWEYMRYSISGIMDMNMFGIPMVGANICGFFKTADEKINLDELCGRWH